MNQYPTSTVMSVPLQNVVEDLADRIVAAVLKDLRSRKGIGDELDVIESDILSEMEHDLAEKVRKLLNPENR